MDGVLPQNTKLGELKLVEVYINYDFPRIFCAIDSLGQKYLAYWCEDNDDSFDWFYLPISEEQLDNIVQNKVSIYEAYTSVRNSVFLVNTPHSGKNDSAEIVELVDDSLLPEKDVFLNR